MGLENRAPCLFGRWKAAFLLERDGEFPLARGGRSGCWLRLAHATRTGDEEAEEKAGKPRCEHGRFIFGFGIRSMQVVAQRKGARPLPAALQVRGEKLEHELAAEFQVTRTPIAVDPAKVVAIQLVVEAVVAGSTEFGVVEGVERLETKFEVRPLGHCELLVQ